jgi:hypothetical protein
MWRFNLSGAEDLERYANRILCHEVLRGILYAPKPTPTVSGTVLLSFF